MDEGDALMLAVADAEADYERIVELNEAGLPPEGDPTELEAGAAGVVHGLVRYGSRQGALLRASLEIADRQ